MYVYICVCVCMNVCMLYVCMHACVYMCVTIDTLKKERFLAVPPPVYKLHVMV